VEQRVVELGVLEQRLLELSLLEQRLVELRVLEQRLVELGVLEQRVLELGLLEQRLLELERPRRRGRPDGLTAVAPKRRTPQTPLSEIQNSNDPGRPSPDGVREGRLGLRAAVYFWLVVAAAAAATLPFLTRLTLDAPGWATFVALGTAVAVAQLFIVVTPGNQSYHTTAAFLVAGALLLPPELVALLATVQHVPDWLKRRLPFHIQTFNIANYTLSAMGAWAAAHVLLVAQPLGPNPTSALAGGAACVVFVLVNHALLAPMLRFARGLSLRESKLFSLENLSIDLVLAMLGVGVAMLWDFNPWLTPFALAPLLLIHRSLSVPALQAEARNDPKTGLYNARHFAATLHEELSRATRFDRPMSLIMADLDLLRDINNTYGHLAGDAVLEGVAKVFREQLRDYDVPARFGGEEFSILLPETKPQEAFEIAERIRRAVAEHDFDVDTSSEPIHVTVSLGVASYPRDGQDANELVHQADFAVYRAKIQGRNRVVDASDEPVLAEPLPRATRLVAVPLTPPSDVPPPRQVPSVPSATAEPAAERRFRPHARTGPRFFSMPARLTLLVAVIGTAGIAIGVFATIAGQSVDVAALLAIIALVGTAQALSIEVERTGTISVTAVGALAGAAIVGPRVALITAVTIAIVDWTARRSVLHQFLFNVGVLTLATLAASHVFSLHFEGRAEVPLAIATGTLAGFVYYALNTGLLACAVALEGREQVWAVWRERFGWLLPHYLVYGFVAGVIYVAYRPIGIWSLFVFALPLFLMRKTQETYVRQSEKVTQKLRAAAETIQTQNVSLEQVNRLLRERSTAAMESLTATVDARDAYTAGHSRRVQHLALAIGAELGMSPEELEPLGHAALFHDIGKLGLPDAILLKPARLDAGEWATIMRHPSDGASIIERLGFLNDAVPAIRHHHERYDGRGYPDRLSGSEIPLGARIIHVADAFDSMLSARVYRPARSLEATLAEIERMAGVQFCPRAAAALRTVIEREKVRILAEAEQPALAAL
jgi:diguanylate cyclase (GGDEF)-like protein/putative nucleotidyltransferase with HDIG domain